MDRNVVLICLDSVRKDRFDQFARRLGGLADTEYAQCRALSSWSAPSHASMFTGALPSQHGVHSHDSRLGKLDCEETFLAALDGYTRIGVSANPFACSFFGFDTLFDHWRDVQPELPFSGAMNANQVGWQSGSDGLDLYRTLCREALTDSQPARSLVNALALSARDLVPDLPIPTFRDDGAREIVSQSTHLVERTSEPFFLFTNFMEAHQPFEKRSHHDGSIADVPTDWSFDGADKSAINASGGLTDPQDRATYRRLYEADIEYLDRVVSEFILELQRRTDRETVVVVTADHGENLGYDCEGNLVDHMASLSEGVLHVPLAVVRPDSPRKTVVDEYVSHRHLGRLLTQLAAGEPAPDITVENPRAEIIGGGEAQNQLPASHDAYERLTRMQRCVYEESRKYRWDSSGDTTVSVIDGGRPSFDEATDGTFDIAEFDARYFPEPITEFKRAVVESTVEQEVSARLRDLGYA